MNWEWEGELRFLSQEEAVYHYIDTGIGFFGLVEILLREPERAEELLDVAKRKGDEWTY